jgi:hypothetical protein
VSKQGLKKMTKPNVQLRPTDLVPVFRIFLFIVGGWLQGQGANPALVEYVQYDPEFLGWVVIAATGLWYSLAKLYDWSR